MYWHVKLFLLLMVTAFLGGITYMAWDYLPLPNNGLAEQEGEQTDVPVVALNGSPQQTKNQYSFLPQNNNISKLKACKI